MLFFGAVTARPVSAMIPRIDMYSTIGELRGGDRRPRCAILSRCAGIPPRQIAVYRPAGCGRRCGVRRCSKVVSSLGASDSGILRLNYQRNTVDVDDSVNQLKRRRAHQSRGHDFSLSTRREIHREDSRPLSRIALQQHIIRRQHVLAMN